MRKNTVYSFWSKVQMGEGCWLWKSKYLATGYGIFRFEGRKWTAHRFAFTVENGPVSQGMEIDHVCHNRACVRPSHLRATTKSENAQNRAGANRNSKSGVRGVYAAGNGWRAVAMVNRNPHQIGYFADLEEAAAAVSAWREKNMPYSEMDRKPA